MTVADAQLLERCTPDHSELAVETTTRPVDPPSWGNRAGIWHGDTGRCAGKPQPSLRGTLRDNNDPVSHLVFSPTKPSVIAVYMEEYSRLPRHMSAPDVKDLPDTTISC